MSTQAEQFTIHTTPEGATRYTTERQPGFTRRLSSTKVRGTLDTYIVAHVSPDETPEGVNAVIRHLERMARGEVAQAEEACPLCQQPLGGEKLFHMECARRENEG